MQASRWRGHGDRLFRKNSLIAVAIGNLIGAAYVWRQWHVSDLFDRFRNRASVAMKSQLAKAIFASSHNFGFEFCAVEDEVLPFSDLSPGTDQRFPHVGLNSVGKQNLDARAEVFAAAAIMLPDWLRATPCSMCKQSGWDDACVVYDNEFVAPKVFGQLSKMAIFDFYG